VVQETRMTLMNATAAIERFCESFHILPAISVATAQISTHRLRYHVAPDGG